MPGREGAEAPLVWADLPSERQAKQRAPVKRAREGDDCRTPGRRAGNLDGVLDCFRARCHKQSLLGEITRRQPIEPLGQVEVRLVGSDVKAGVGKLAQLPCDGLDDARMPVSRVENGDSAAKSM